MEERDQVMVVWADSNGGRRSEATRQKKIGLHVVGRLVYPCLSIDYLLFLSSDQFLKLNFDGGGV